MAGLLVRMLSCMKQVSPGIPGKALDIFCKALLVSNRVKCPEANQIRDSSVVSSAEIGSSALG
jgi:hypothetical protein